MSTTVRIVFNRLPEIAQKLPHEASIVVRKAAFDVEANAKTLVPVDTGNLKNSIQTTIEDGGLSAEVGTRVEYSEFVEFGTRRMAAQPYMVPAAEAVDPSFQAAMRQLLGRL